jgi:hypothetical protein
MSEENLRDQFAMVALIALMSSSAWVEGFDDFAVAHKVDFKKGIALHAYALADQMMEARK